MHSLPVKLMVIKAFGALAVMAITSCNIKAQLHRERIIFDSDRLDGKSYELFSISNDGSDLRQHTNDAVFRRANTNGQFSPDGKYVLFGTYKYGGYKIAIANRDFTNQRKFSPGGNYSYVGSWSPDGRKVVYNKIATEKPPYFQGDSEIFVIDVDGDNDQNISKMKGEDSNPVWSDDGRFILFASNRNGNFEIYRMEPDGSNVKNLTNTPTYHEFGASWSPDTKTIAFHQMKTGKGNRYIDLVILELQSGKLTNLTQNETTKRNLFVPYYEGAGPIFYKTSWSQDGSQIVYSSKRNSSNFELFVYDLNHNQLKQLTSNGSNNVFPNWYLAHE